LTVTISMTRVLGLGVGDGVGAGEGVGLGAGVAAGEGVGLGAGVAAGVGDGDGDGCCSGDVGFGEELPQELRRRATAAQPRIENAVRETARRVMNPPRVQMPRAAGGKPRAAAAGSPGPAG
jgi:hypothetical protein